MLAALLPGNARGSVADSQPNRTFVTNGPVQAVVRSGDTIYIGGRFNRVGPRTGPGVEFALDGSQNTGLPEVTGGGGTVQAVASDGSGGWYIGGLFTHVGGVARNNIAHIRRDHSVDPAFDPNANDGIHALAVSGSTVYAAGLFTSIGGQTRNRIAGLNAANGTATAFNPNADAAVEALAISGSIVYAGGRFTSIGGLPRNNIAALNAADGTAALTFNPASDGIVLALAISGQTLYVGGFFKVIGGQVRSNIAALNAGGPLDGTAVLTFNPNANAGGTIPGAGGVEALAVSASGSTVYAGGLFTNIGGQNRRYFAALNATDGTATAFNPNPNGNILGLALSVNGLTVYAAGGFNSFDGLPSIGGQARNYLAAINAADGTATAFNPNPNDAAFAVGVSGSAVYVGGAFSSIGGLVRHGIAALNAADGTATSFDPNASFGAGNATVYALAVSGSTIYAGGFFTSVGGQPRNYIAALNAADGTATTWNPGSNSTVETLVVSGSIIYAGGDFTSIGGQPRNFIAALNLTDGSPTAFNPSANSSVAALAVSGPLVYVGGFFTSIGGQTRNKIAALNTADGSATSWNPDATTNANVLALAVSGSTIYAGGDFVTIGGQARKNIAALNASDGMATSFDPQASDGVYALALSGSTVYAAGFFSTIGGQTRNLVAELNPTDGAATSFDPGADPGFGAFALTVALDGTLYIGGSFRTFDFAFQQGFAAFSNPSPMLTGVVSRKTHGSAGTFDVDLPITGNPGIECRSGAVSGNHQVVFTFAAPVTVTDATVTPGPGGTASLSLVPGFDHSQVIVSLTSVSNAQTLTINLLGVSDGSNKGNVHGPMSVLLGDVNASGVVNTGDTNLCKAQALQPVTNSNFRNDINASGVINTGDVNIIKQNALSQLPP
jgi:trimeric autotransporter adhesin